MHQQALLRAGGQTSCSTRCSRPVKQLTRPELVRACRPVVAHRSKALRVVASAQAEKAKEPSSSSMSSGSTSSLDYTTYDALFSTNISCPLVRRLTRASP